MKVVSMVSEQHKGFDESELLIYERIDRWCDEYEDLCEKWSGKDDDFPRIEQFLPSSSEPNYEEALEELMGTELDLRVKHLGSRGELQEWMSRFPDWPQLITRVHEEHCITRAGVSTVWDRDEGDHPQTPPASDGSSQQRPKLPLDPHRLKGGANAELEGASSDDSLKTDSALVEERMIDEVRRRLSGARGMGPGGRQLPCEFGAYELLSVAGQGGMGTVYEAQQRATNRRVAVKLIRDDRLSHGDRKYRQSLRRFRQEATIAAGIEHENWVTVYEVGESLGYPYYSMQFVEGESLARLARNGPLSGHRAAGYLEPVCRALDLAHQRGIVHRDVKPHNLLVDRRTDQASLTDFGLSKLQDDGHSATRTGDVLGSPGYLSPEQATDSSRCDARTDVYGVGATLYFLITGRPPFQSTSFARTLQMICQQEPIEPRKLNPDIPRDLETICLKSLTKEPGGRYGSAADLAEDLNRFLAGRPVQARPVGPLVRLGRLARRYPVVAGLASAVSLLILTIAVGASLAWRITHSALKETNRSLSRERDSRQEMTETVVSFVESVTSEPMMREPKLQPLRQSLMGASLERIDRLLESTESDDLQRLRYAQIYRRLGHILLDSGEIDRAEEATDKSLDAVRFLAESGVREAQDSYAQTRLLQCHIRWETGRVNAASNDLAQLIDRLSMSDRMTPTSSSIRLRALTLAVDVALSKGDFARAKECSEALRNLVPMGTDAVEEEAALVHLRSLPIDQRLEMASAYEHIAQIALYEGNLELAEWGCKRIEECWQAHETYEWLLENYPADSDHTVDQAITTRAKIEIRLRNQRWILSETVAAHDELLSSFVQLSAIAADRQNSTAVRISAAQTLADLVSLVHRDGAEVSVDEGMLRDAVKTAIDGRQKRRSAVKASSEIALVLAWKQKQRASLDEAVGELTRARSVLREFLGRSDRDVEMESLLVTVESALARTLLQCGRVAESRRIVEKCKLRCKSQITIDRIGQRLAEQLSGVLLLEYQIANTRSSPNSSSEATVELVAELSNLSESFPEERGILFRLHIASLYLLADESDFGQQHGFEQLKAEFKRLEALGNVHKDQAGMEAACQVVIDLAVKFGRSENRSQLYPLLDELILLLDSSPNEYHTNPNAFRLLAEAQLLKATLEFVDGNLEAADKSYSSFDARIDYWLSKHSAGTGTLPVQLLSGFVNSYVARYRISARTSNSPNSALLEEGLACYDALIDTGVEPRQLSVVYTILLREAMAVGRRQQDDPLFIAACERWTSLTHQPELSKPVNLLLSDARARDAWRNWQALCSEHDALERASSVDVFCRYAEAVENRVTNMINSVVYVRRFWLR